MSSAVCRLVVVIVIARDRRATARRQDQYLTQYIQDRLEPLHILDSWTPSSFGMHPRAAIARRGVCFGSIVPSADLPWVPTAAELDAPLHRPPPRDGSTALEPSRAAETRRTRQDRGRAFIYIFTSYTVDGRVCACAGRVCPRVSVECVLSVRAREDGGGKGGGREAVAEGLKGRGEAEGRRRFVRPVSVPQASTFYGRRRTGRTRSPWSPA